MPINATPEYDKAEARYRQAVEPAEQLECLQEMLRLIPKHKGSEKAQSEIKRKISTLKKQMESAAKAGGAATDPYYVPRGGAGQIAVIGQPNTGKSSILAAVTEAKVRIEAYPYSTTAAIPGMWPWNDVQLQLIDTPPLSGEEMPGPLASLVRRADLTLIVADPSSPEVADQVSATLAALAQRNITLLDSPRDAIDDPNGRSGLLVLTHRDRVAPEDIDLLGELLELQLACVAVDCPGPGGFDDLAGHIWRLLHKIRIYTREPGSREKPADPFTLPVGSTVEDLALHIHRDLAEKLKFARIWGEGRHDGQQVHHSEVLHDGDLVELHV